MGAPPPAGCATLPGSSVNFGARVSVQRPRMRRRMASKRQRRGRTRQAPELAGVAAARGAWPARSGARAPTRCQPSRWTVGRPASAAGAGRTQRSGFGVALTWGTLSSITPASQTRTDRVRPRIRGFSIRSATGRTACACEPQLHVSAHAHQTCTPFRRIFSPLPANQSRTVFVGATADTPAFAGRLHREVVAHRGPQALSDADCLQSPRRQRQQQRLHAARLKVQPAAPGNTGVAGRADERRVPASWSPGLPKRPCQWQPKTAHFGQLKTAHFGRRVPTRSVRKYTVNGRA